MRWTVCNPVLQRVTARISVITFEVPLKIMLPSPQPVLSALAEVEKVKAEAAINDANKILFFIRIMELEVGKFS